jgi:WD40 repeat protein
VKPAIPAASASLDKILGITNVDDNLDTFRQRILAGSCQWILEKDAFRDWVEKDRTSTVFWLTGLPGTGKTTLSSFIIDYLSQGSVPGMCQYHFFQAEHHDTSTISFLLRSLAFQIAEKCEVFRTMLLEMHQETGLAWATQKYNLIWEKVFEGLLFRLNLEGPLFWVLDGLDEAESAAALVSLVSKIRSATPIKILLVSRHTKELSVALSGDSCPVHHDEIQISDTAGDIRSYVSAIVRQTLPNVQERDIVIERILSKASGSFLWVRLALERIKDSWHTKDDIERALTEIPEGMEFMYERMIAMVARQPPRLRRMATEILTWTACAFRPFDINELAVALKPEFGDFFNLEVTIAQICGNFIVTEKSRVALIHQTARQFLVSKNPHLPISLDSRRGHEHIATVCMNFLSDNKWRTTFAMAQETEDDANSNKLAGLSNDVPFLWYATAHWAYHVSCAPADSEDLQTSVFNFLERFSLLWINAVALTGNLRIIIRSAQYLKAYAKRKARHQTQAPPTSLNSTRVGELQQWANDFIRLVGRFGVYLAQSPSSIYKHVIPFCPSDSMIRQTFSHLSRSAISVVGISSGKWDDCLARVTMGGDETASKVICKDNYFITLLGTSGTLVVWHAETCLELRRLYHGEYVTGIKASKAKTLVASAGIKTIRVWDIATGQEVYKIPKSTQGRLMGLAFTAEDTKLLVAYDDCTVRCINPQSLLEEWCFHARDPLEADHGCPRLMAFSPDAKRIAVAHRGRPVFVWWISSQRQPPQCCVRREDVYKRDGDVWNAPEVVVWQPDSSNVLILYQDTILVDWNIDDDTRTQHSHIGAREMVVSSDGNLLLTSDHNETLSVWSTGEFHLIYRLKYDEFVRDIAFAPDAQRLYDIRGTLCNIWEPDALIRSEDTNLEELSTHDTLYSGPVVTSHDSSRIQVSALICSETGQYYCTGKDNGSVVIYELDTVQKLRKLYSHSTTVSVVGIVWSSSLKYIASVDESGRVIAKRLAKPTAQAPKKWAVYPLLDVRIGSTVTQLLFSASEEFLLISSATVDRVWSTKTKKELFRVQHRDGNGKPRRWIQHPHEGTLLICIEGEEQCLSRWDTLERVQRHPLETKNLELKVDADEVPSDSVNNLTLRETRDDSLPQDATPIISSPALSSLNTLERVFQIRDRYLILEYQSSRSFSFSNSGAFYPSESRQLEVIDINETPSEDGLRRRSLPELSRKVNRLIGVFQGRLVFLDHQYWLCTWELLDRKDDESRSGGAYRRHFFLPKDWLSPETLNLVTLNHFGTLLCPKDGEVAIVRSGIRM